MRKWEEEVTYVSEGQARELRELLEISVYNSQDPCIKESEGEFRLINGIWQKVIVQGPPEPVLDHPMLAHMRKSKHDR